MTLGLLKSTFLALGRSLTKPHSHRSACLPVAKFSPLIQMASTEPSVVLPACFSPRTLFTASTVSPTFTWFKVMPYFSFNVVATNPVAKALIVSDPPYMYQLTVWPRASAAIAARHRPTMWRRRSATWSGSSSRRRSPEPGGERS